jgi:hypothetical protein
LHQRFETFSHGCERVAADAQGSQTEWSDLEIALRSSPALGRGIAERRRDIPFVLESIQRSVQRANGQRPAGASLDLQANGHAVRLVAEPQNGQQDNLFELAYDVWLPLLSPSAPLVETRASEPGPSASGTRTRARSEPRCAGLRRRGCSISSLRSPTKLAKGPALDIRLTPRPLASSCCWLGALRAP